MKKMPLILCLVFAKCISLFAQGQMIIKNGSIKGEKKYGQQNVPIWRSQNDSIRIADLDAEVERLATSQSGRRQLDSIFQLRSKLYQDAIIGFRKVFYPSRDYLTADSVAKMSDRSIVKKLSIYEGNQFPQYLLDCKNLQYIEFINTTFDVLPVELDQFRELQTVYIYNNRPKKALSLAENTTIKTLVLRGNDPKKFPKSYKNLKAMTNLDLSENDLKKFPNGGRHNKNLKELHLQRNQLTMKGSIKKHPYLDQLLLQFNPIVHVPRKISKFANLKKLTFNTNKVESVSPRIGKLTKLEHLSFYKNQLKAIPKAVYGLSSLREIDLFYNQIETLDPEFTQWKNLRSLYLSYNKLVSLPENINELKSLDGLYVWDNRITSLPEHIGEMTNLRFLRVNRNYIKTLPSSIVWLTNLQELNLGKNQLTELPEKILDFPNLKILVLENNPWSAPTRKFISDKVEDLRKRDVYVHVSEVPGSTQ